MREAGQQYHGEVQAADAQRKRVLGPPHIDVFGALLKVARDCLALLTPPPDTVQALTRNRTKLGQVSREVVERLVSVAKLSRTRQPDQTRVQLRITDEEMQTGVCLSLTHLGARHLTGDALP